MKVLVSALLLLAVAAPARAWLEAGHLVTAHIAYQRLEPETRAEADRLIALLADFAPVRADFVSASVWLDDVKKSGWRAFDRWHYINLPYNAEGLSHLPPAHTDDAVRAVADAFLTLREERATDLAKAFSLRVLIHVVGDLHQPLHCVNRFSENHPMGDRGGNDFALAEENLHYYWDEAAGLFGALDASSERAAIDAAAADLLDAVPEEAVPDWQQLNPREWSRESYRLATSVAYVGVREGREPSEGYRIRAQLVAQRRLVMAGYRLAALLEAALGAHVASPVVPSESPDPLSPSSPPPPPR